MDFRDSGIMQTTIRKIVPFALVFALYIFTFGADLPGGGFQAGVVFGTVIVVIELALNIRLYPNRVYQISEIIGALLLFIVLWVGLLSKGTYFGDFHLLKSGPSPFSNTGIWILNLAVFIEVLSSMVLIFRYLISWRRQAE